MRSPPPSLINAALATSTHHLPKRPRLANPNASPPPSAMSHAASNDTRSGGGGGGGGGEVGRGATTTIMTLQVKLDDAYRPHARAPTRGSQLAAGYDLYAAESVVLPGRGGRKVVQTGIRVAVPAGCYGRVAPRSGLATKHGIDVGAGVVDADYRGLLGILLFNFGEDDFQVNPGDRIAQLVLERIATPDVHVVETLSETQRGEGGFGSTGGFGAQADAAAPGSKAA